jgi:hypothetical protein
MREEVIEIEEIKKINEELLQKWNTIQNKLYNHTYIEKIMTKISFKENFLYLEYGGTKEKEFSLDIYFKNITNHFNDELPNRCYFDMMPIINKYHNLSQENRWMFFQWKDILRDCLQYMKTFFHGKSMEILHFLGIEETNLTKLKMKRNQNSLFFKSLTFEVDLIKSNRKYLWKWLDVLKDNFSFDMHHLNIHLGLRSGAISYFKAERGRGYQIKALQDIYIKKVHLPVLLMKETCAGTLVILDKEFKVIMKQEHIYKGQIQKESEGVFDHVDLMLKQGETCCIMFGLQKEYAEFLYKEGKLGETRTLDNFFELWSLQFNNAFQNCSSLAIGSQFNVEANYYNIEMNLDIVNC